MSLQLADNRRRINLTVGPVQNQPTISIAPQRQPRVNIIVPHYNPGPGSYYQSAPPQPHRNWFQRNIEDPAVSAFDKSVNTVGAGVTGLTGLGWIGYESLFGNDQDYQNSLDATQGAMNDILNHGVGNKGAFMSSQEAQNADLFGNAKQRGDFIKPVLRGVAADAPYVVPFGKLAEGASIPVRMAAQGGANGLVAGGTDIANQYANNGKINWGEVGRSTATGTALGAAFPAAGGVLSKFRHTPDVVPPEPTKVPVYVKPGSRTVKLTVNNLDKRLGEIRQQLKAMPSPNDVNSAVFNLKTNFAHDLQKVKLTTYDPNYKQALVQRLTERYKNNLASINDAVDARKALDDEASQIKMHPAYQAAHPITGPVVDNVARDNLTVSPAQMSEGVSKMRAVRGDDELPYKGSKIKVVSKPSKVSFKKTKPSDSAFPKIAAGDYERARLLPQSVTDPIKVIGERLVHQVKQLKKSSPDEYKHFWELVEHPDAEMSDTAREAVDRWRMVADRVHGAANAGGRETQYIKNFALHPWILKHLSEDDIANGKGLGILNEHRIARKHGTIAEGKQAGLELSEDPLKDVQKYVGGSTNALHRLLAKKAVEMADAGKEKGGKSLDLGWGMTVPLSEEGFAKTRGLEFAKPSSNKLIKGARKVNVGLKSSILAGGQFHPINIALLRAGPTLAMKGDFAGATKGIYGTFRPLFPGGKQFVDRAIMQDIRDGTMDKAADIGMPYGTGAETFDAAGSGLKGGVGHRLVFGSQMPMMHREVVRSIIKDLEKKNIDLSSGEARKAGVVGNATMGYINRAALNVGPNLRQGMSDFLLAGQYTPSKIVTVSNVLKGGVAGKYARADVAANAAAALGLIAGIGYLTHQKSDDIRDLMLRALVDPRAPTGMKDSKGNNVSVSMPATYTGELAKLLGFKLTRGKDGHLGVQWNPGNMGGGIVDWGRSRLSPAASTIMKVTTNTDYGTKPLFDPSAPAGTKAIQAATQLSTDMLPIGLQGVPYSNAVKDHLPGTAKEILDANTPGTNPVVKSLLSSVAIRVGTDQTVGKARDSAIYFDSKNAAESSLKNAQAKTAFDLYTGSKKNPVTKKYDTQPTVWDGIAKATALLQNPSAIDALIAMNKRVAAQGGKVDPLWSQPRSHIISYFQDQANPDPLSAQKSVWQDKNKSWYAPLSQARSKFFDSLPPSDPNKPAAPVPYPEPTKQVSAAMDKYFSITDSTQKFNYLQQHPEVQQQFDKQFQYKNELLKNRGYAQYKGYPEPTPAMQEFINRYMAADKTTRKAIRAQSPGGYQAMSAYFDSVDLYTIGQNASKNQLQSQPDYTSKEAGDMSKLAQDIYQNPDGTYSIVPAGWMNGMTNSGSGSGGGGYYSGGKYYSSGGSSGGGFDYAAYNKANYEAKLAGMQASAENRNPRPKTATIHLKAGTMAPVSVGKKSAKPKVAIKKSKV